MFLQDNNAIVREFGQPRQEEKLYNHVDLVQLLDIVNLEAGTSVAGADRAMMLNRSSSNSMLAW